MPDPNPGAPVENRRPIRSRRAAREVAVQSVYQMDVGGSTPDQVLNDLDERCEFFDDQDEYVRDLIVGLNRMRTRIDGKIDQFLNKNWELDRIAKTDLAILRVAAYELFERADIPPKVTINEAVMLAKAFTGPESGRFINGLLGSLLKASPKKDFVATATPPVENIIEEEPFSELPEVEEENVEEGSPEYEKARKLMKWEIRGEKKEDP